MQTVPNPLDLEAVLPHIPNNPPHTLLCVTGVSAAQLCTVGNPTLSPLGSPKMSLFLPGETKPT